MSANMIDAWRSGCSNPCMQALVVDFWLLYIGRKRRFLPDHVLFVFLPATLCTHTLSLWAFLRNYWDYFTFTNTWASSDFGANDFFLHCVDAGCILRTEHVWVGGLDVVLSWLIWACLRRFLDVLLGLKNERSAKAACWGCVGREGSMYVVMRYYSS
jgi:hypothetical protein